VRPQDLDRVVAKCLRFLTVVARKALAEMFDQYRHVFQSLAERRDLKWDHVQAIKKIVTKVSILDQIFELEDVRKEASNWFMVEPDEGSGMLTTITPIDTRIVAADGISLGLASEAVVDGMFVLVGSERSPDRAQLVVKVVDEDGRSIAGVTGNLTAEIVAHREAGAWIIGDAQTDDSGMIFFGNVPASPSLAKESILLTGAVNASVEALSLAGATTIVVAVVSPP
jgi:hypothetical protein